MSTEENKTVLLPSAQASDTLTTFESPKAAQENTENFKKNTRIPEYGARSQEKVSGLMSGTNAFLALAAPLFKEIDMLLNTYEIGSMSEIHTRLTEEVDRFTDRAAQANLENSQVLITRYLLCTFMDELISTTYWGKENNWANDSLLSFFYHETYGGEKFFQLLNKLLVSPANHIDLLELMYVCIGLGFEGKYRIQDKGKMELEAIRDNLYKQIRNVHGHHSENFYVRQEAKPPKNRLFHKATSPVFFMTVGVMLLIINIALSLALHGDQERFIEKVEKEKALFIKEAASERKEPAE